MKKYLGKEDEPMPRKPKFEPEITQVKLNPEQAVLVCSCHASSTTSAASVAMTCDDPFNGKLQANPCGKRAVSASSS